MSQWCGFVIGHAVARVLKMGAKQYCTGDLQKRKTVRSQ